MGPEFDISGLRYFSKAPEKKKVFSTSNNNLVFTYFSFALETMDGRIAQHAASCGKYI